jgi:undecaprenyl pyrophosphate phosphatase UppP
MAQTGFDKIAVKLKGHVKKNWGSPFIVGFILLLVSAAVSLSEGLSSLADGIAVFAYYALIVGVILQLVCFVKYREKVSEAEAV